MKLENSFIRFIFTEKNIIVFSILCIIGILNGQFEMINYWLSIFIGCVITEYLYVMNNVRMTRRGISNDIVKGTIILGAVSGVLMWFLLNTRGANVRLSNSIDFINGILYNLFFALGGAWIGIFITKAKENKKKVALGLIATVIVFIGGIMIGSLIYTDFEYSQLFYGDKIIEYIDYVRWGLIFILGGMVIFLKNNIKKNILNIEWI